MMAMLTNTTLFIRLPASPRDDSARLLMMSRRWYSGCVTARSICGYTRGTERRLAESYRSTQCRLRITRASSWAISR